MVFQIIAARGSQPSSLLFQFYTHLAFPLFRTTGKHRFVFSCCGFRQLRQPSPYKCLSSLRWPSCVFVSCQTGCPCANAEKSVRVCVWRVCENRADLGSVVSPRLMLCDRHLADTPLSDYTEESVCVALLGPLRFTHTYALFVAPLPRQESQISCHGSGNRQHLQGV